MARVSRPALPKTNHKADILHKKRHELAWSADGPVKINQRLHEAVLSVPPFPVADSLFKLTFAHISQGYYSRGSSFGWHQHSDYQLEVALAGQFVFETKTSRFVLLPGEALLISPRTEHQWETKTGGVMLGADLHRSMLARKIRCMETAANQEAFHVREELLLKFVQSLGHALSVKRFSALSALGLTSALAGVVASTLSACLSSVDAMLENDRFSDGNNHSVEIVERTCKFLVDNLTRKVSVSELNKISGLTPRHLNRLFRRHVGTSLHQFVIDARLLRAEELLRNRSDLLIKEVAFSCGFHSTGHLTTFMKRRRGMIPSQIVRR
jgi:AraC-like DNA-binding protein